MRSTFQSRMRLAYVLSAVLPTAAYLLPVLSAIVLMCVAWPVSVSRDAQNTAHQTAEVRVIAITPVPEDRFSAGYSQVILRIAGHDVDCFCSVPLRVGDCVRVDYRVGQSGRVYIDGIRPLGPRSMLRRA